VWEEKDKRWADSFSEFSGAFASFMQDIDLYTWLSGTAGGRPIMMGKGLPLELQLYSGDQITGTPDPVDPTKLQQMVLSWQNSTQSSVTTTEHHWTAEGFFKTVDGEPTTDVWEDEAYPNGSNPYGRIPVQLFHNSRLRNTSFILPPTDLVKMNLHINRKLTDLNWRAMLSGDIMVTQGYTDEDPPMLGVDSWVDLGDNGDLKFVGPDPRVSDTVETINLFLRVFCMSRRIPESAIQAVQSGESGIKIVADQASIVDYLEARASLFRPWEQEFIRLCLFVKAYHSGESVRYEDIPAPGISYAIPRKPMDADQRDEWDRLMKLNLATPVDELMDKDPSLDSAAALKKIEDNMAINRKLNVAQGTPPAAFMYNSASEQDMMTQQ
jgi:hypothetical protein